jgi:hypothetical protein
MIKTNVNSNNIKSIGYQNNILEVEFKTSRIYQYSGVPISIYNQLMMAPSKGTFLSQHIKNNYPCIKVG